MSIARISIPQTSSALARNSIPVIDRMMDLIGVLERGGRGLSISELTGLSKLPRTTVYRILNTLQRHDMVHRDGFGAYRLGRRITTLAANVAATSADAELVAKAQPFLDRLAADLGNSAKLSIIDEDGVLVVAVAQGRLAYALTVTPGQRIPPHAGAAGKLLLAHLPAERLEQWLSQPLPALTAKTIVVPKRLKAELARIRRQGWARDDGESAPSILAFAAPVFDRRGAVRAALSLPFLLGTQADRMRALRLAAIEAGRAITAAFCA
jgi:DNA-binding IclR family transcriptional regulator